MGGRFMRRFSRVGLFAVIASSAAGCGGGDKGKIWIYHYPDFYTPELKRIAVLPFQNRSHDRSAGERISGKVSALLTNNGTYEVYTRSNLADILAEKDLQDAGIIEGDAAIEIGRLKSVQALVCGVCDQCGVQSRSETRIKQIPQFARDANGNLYISGYIQQPYLWSRHDAAVECRVVVVDTTTGRQIAAVQDPTVTYAEGSPPKYGPNDLLRGAEDDQVAKIARAICVTKTEIKLKGKVLRTATGQYDNEWDWKDKFTTADKQIVAVVTLPADADRNSFKLVIRRKESREPLAEQAFEWSKQKASRGFTFPQAELISKGGEGEFEVKLYSGPEPVAWYPFTLSRSKNM